MMFTIAMTYSQIGEALRQCAKTDLSKCVQCPMRKHDLLIPDECSTALKEIAAKAMDEAAKCALEKNLLEEAVEELNEDLASMQEARLK